MGRVNITTLWASSPTFLTDPGGAKIATGWINEGGIANWQNWWQNRTDQALEEIERRGIQIYSAGTVYYKGGLAIGSDDGVYQAEIINPAVDPVGAPAGNWHLVHGPVPYAITVFNVGDDDPAWSPGGGAHSLKVTLTGGGGGGGGTPVAGGGTATSIGGGGGGTGIHAFEHLNGTTYAVVIGAGGLGVSGLSGLIGGSSSIADGVDTITATGGAGGASGAGTSTDQEGMAGGAAALADIDIAGGYSSSGGDGAIGGFSQSGGSLWMGSGIPSTVDGAAGLSAVFNEIGVGGGAVGAAASERAGGDGGPGCIVVEEYF